MSGLRYDPEYYSKVISAQEPSPPQPPWQNPYQLRDFTNGILTTVMAAVPKPDAIQEQVFPVTSYDGAEIEVTRFATAENISSPEPTPAVIYAHGGGMVAGSVKIFAPLIASLALASGLPFFAVEYRLAPEYSAPCGVEDAFAALKHVSEHAAELNVDAARIAMMGESAGGGIAAGATLLARDRQLSPPVAKQILVYPMLDDSTELAPGDPLEGFLSWTTANNVVAWGAYIGKDKRGKADADVSPYAAPVRAAPLKGLPPTYIDVGTLDLFRDEDIAFASRLAKEQVEIELHVWPGVPHGFDGFRGLKWGERAPSSRIDAIKRTGS